MNSTHIERQYRTHLKKLERVVCGSCRSRHEQGRAAITFSNGFRTIKQRSAGYRRLHRQILKSCKSCEGTFRTPIPITEVIQCR